MAIRADAGGVCVGAAGVRSACCYRQARKCPTSDGSLVDVWMHVVDANKFPGAFSIGTHCYYFDFADPTSQTHGTLYTAADAVPHADCPTCETDEGCTCHCLFSSATSTTIHWSAAKASDGSALPDPDGSGIYASQSITLPFVPTATWINSSRPPLDSGHCCFQKTVTVAGVGTWFYQLACDRASNGPCMDAFATGWGFWVQFISATTGNETNLLTRIPTEIIDSCDHTAYDNAFTILGDCGGAATNTASGEAVEFTDRVANNASITASVTVADPC
jgi:hypothetical protein